MSRLTLTFGIALGLGALAVGTLGPAPSEAAADEDVLAQWDKNYAKAFKKAAKEHVKLSDWCAKNGLQWTANNTRRGVFTYLPDDAKVRKYFGYHKRGGRWVQDEQSKDHFRNNFIDDKDPESDKMRKNRDRLQKKISDFFLKLARNARSKARKAAEEEGGEALAAEWKTREKKAYQPVLDLRPGIDKHKLEAHRELGHPKFAGMFVTPYQLRHMEVRAQRKSLGGEISTKAIEAKDEEANGPIGSLKLGNAAGASSEHFFCNTVYGKEHAKRVVQIAEMVLEDAIQVFGLPPDFRATIQLDRIDIMTDKPQVLSYLKQLGWTEEQIKKGTKHTVNMIRPRFGVLAHPEGQNDQDMVASQVRSHVSNRMTAWARPDVRGWLPRPEDWVWVTMGYDATVRLFGTHKTHWVGDPNYGRPLRARADQDAWIIYAREQVMFDDDVPLSRLWKLSVQEQQFGAREITKGYALMQYFFESDAGKAKKFFYRAVAIGTPQAAVDVYGEEILGAGNVPEGRLPVAKTVRESVMKALPLAYTKVLEELDDRYREWIMKAW